MSKKTIATAFISATLLLGALSLYASAKYFENNPHTHNTYINANESFSSEYYTGHKPTLEYRYTNLKCDNENAKLEVTLYAKKIRWYNILEPSEFKVGSKEASGINGSSGIWYGYTYRNIDCSSSSDIVDKWDYNLAESANIRYYYAISNNNRSYLHNKNGEWRVICTYNSN